MSLIVVKAKRRWMSEDDLELDSELGITPKSAEWRWRMRAIDAGDIYTIYQHTKTKSIVEMQYGEKILVDEPFTSLVAKWEAEKPKDLNLSEELSEEFFEEDGEDE